MIFLRCIRDHNQLLDTIMLLCHVLKHLYNLSLAMIKDGAAAAY